MNITNLEQNLKCPICWNISEDPYESTCCGHIFCKNCSNKLIDKKCPICRKVNVNFAKNSFAKKLLEEIKIPCVFGCSDLVTINKMKEHRNNCDYAEFTCTIDNCNFTGVRKKFTEHMFQEHIMQMMILTEHYGQMRGIFDKISKNSLAGQRIVRDNSLGSIRNLRTLNTRLHNFHEPSGVSDMSLSQSYFDELL